MGELREVTSPKKWRRKIITALIVGLALPVASPMMSNAVPAVAPVFTSSSSTTVAENTYAVLDVNTDTDTTFSIIPSTVDNNSFDSALFTIDSVTGQLSFTSAPNFESPTDTIGDNIYIVIVRATQTSTAVTTDQTIYVTVTDVNEAPVITSNGAGSTAAISVTETATAVTTVTSSDVDSVTSPTYSITGGADSATFSINETGTLTLNSAQDYDALAPNDTLTVVVTVTDSGGLTDNQTITVTITDVNDITPVIDSNGGGPTASISIPETTSASTVITTLTYVDTDTVPGGGSTSRTIIGGADSATFTMNIATGELSLNTAQNFESMTAPYELVVVVQVSDGTYTDNQTITVTITDVNETPTITSDGGGDTASVDVYETTTAVTTVTATDVDTATTLTYTIVGGADSATFGISAGVLTLNSLQNFDTMTGTTLEVVVQVSDGGSPELTDNQTITVTIKDVNDITPVITSNGGGQTATVTVPETASASTIITTVTYNDSDTVNTLPSAASGNFYSIIGGADSATFNISSAGVLTFVAPGPDFEVQTSFEVVVLVSDGDYSDSQTITVTITDVNAPIFLSTETALPFEENDTVGIDGFGGILDVNVDKLSTFSIIPTSEDASSFDASLFTIDPTTGMLSWISPPNFEDTLDHNDNNIYVVKVRATLIGGGSNESTGQTVYVTVTDVNEAPVITSNGGGQTATVTIGEDTTTVTTVIATDEDTSTSLTYSIIGGSDSASFTLNPTTGVLTLNSSVDFDPAPYAPVFEVVVQVSDNESPELIDYQTITVTIGDVNDIAPVITSDGGGQTATVTVGEDTTTVTTITSTDTETVGTVTYTIIGGDSSTFTLDPTTGVLVLNSAQNYEPLGQTFTVVVQVSDGISTDTQTITVIITDVNEAPVITSNGGGDTAAINVAEDTTTVTTVTATDVDTATTLTYSIFGGANSSDFSIDSSTGVLTLNSLTNFEVTSGTLEVVVEVSDGMLSDYQTITVTITDVNEHTPVITSDGAGDEAAINVAEASTAVTTVIATDADTATAPSYSIVGGVDSATFTIDSTTGVLTMIAQDFDTLSPGTTFVVVVQASDGTNTDNQTITVTITAVNESAPVIGSDGGGEYAYVDVAENSTVVTTVTAIDADTNTVLVYSIISGGETFTIDSSSGELALNSAYNFEGYVPSLQVVVQVSDGTNTDIQTITVTITDVNEAPVVSCVGTPGGLICSWTPWDGAGYINFYQAQVYINGNWISNGVHLDNTSIIGGLAGTTSYQVRVRSNVDQQFNEWGETTTSTLALPTGPTGPVGPAPIIIFNPVTPGAPNTTPLAVAVQDSETVTVTLTIPVGEKGETGTAGTNGAAGAKGETGTAGTNGATGATGAKGDTGAAGAAGAAGATGAAGAKGDKGDKGDTGATGPKGDTGATGPKGATSIFGVIAYKNAIYTLTAKDKKAIQQAGIKKGATITVAGYASKVGSTALNQRLSKNRADSIAKQIKALLPNINVRSVGYGEKVNKACTKYANRCAVVSITQPANG
jgi:outer membrane protein OmpA-like peptidoglycan-associated protein